MKCVRNLYNIFVICKEYESSKWSSSSSEFPLRCLPTMSVNVSNYFILAVYRGFFQYLLWLTKSNESLDCAVLIVPVPCMSRKLQCNMLLVQKLICLSQIITQLEIVMDCIFQTQFCLTNGSVAVNIMLYRYFYILKQSSY